MAATADAWTSRALPPSQPPVMASSPLRIRAERRVGELLAAQARNTGGRPKPLAAREGLPTLAEQGITHSDSARFQRLAAVPEPAFERAVQRVATGCLYGFVSAGESGVVDLRASERDQTARRFDEPDSTAVVMSARERDRFVL